MPESTETTSKGHTSKGRVVVGIDDSEPARDALRRAADIAKARGWRLTVIHTWHITYPTVPYAIVPPDFTSALRDAAEATMHQVVEDALGPHPDVEVNQVLTEGPAAAVLVEASEDADLLVVGSRGRGGFASLTLGSVSSACVHHAHCAVLVLRPHKESQEPA